MQTSLKVTFTLQRLVFAYHSTLVSNICHEANPCRGDPLLFNCAIPDCPIHMKPLTYKLLTFCLKIVNLCVTMVIKTPLSKLQIPCHSLQFITAVSQARLVLN